MGQGVGQVRRAPGVEALVALWLRLHPAQSGLILAAVLTCAVAGVRYVPIGPAVRFNGIVERVGVGVSTRYAFPIAYVKLDVGDRVVRLTQANGCSAGNRIVVVRQRYLWGTAYDAAGWPCPAPTVSPAKP